MLGGFQNILPPMNSNRPLNVMQLVPALEGGGVERGIGGLSGGVLQCMCATAARHACVAALHLVGASVFQAHC